MLQTQTVEPRTFSILRELMEIPEMQDFHLVGVTALSLLYGHRISEDLDLFTNIKFENETVANSLTKKFEDNIIIRSSSNFGIFSFIENVKVDIIRFPHPFIRPIQIIDGIRMFSVEDIIAMKVQAILGRGKKKDFWDVAELLDHYTVADFVKFHKEKYTTQNLLITVPQAITYFDDADESEDPTSLKNQTWQSVKNKIQKKVRQYLV